MTSENNFEKLERYGPLDIHEKAEYLELENTRLKDQIWEERFYWLFALVILFDAVVFMHMPNWGGPVSILCLELIGLVAAAKKCGVDIVVEYTDKMLAILANNKN